MQVQEKEEEKEKDFRIGLGALDYPFPFVRRVVLEAARGAGEANQESYGGAADVGC